jgi:hypothetical protein
VVCLRPSPLRVTLRWSELPASQRLVAASDAAGPSRPVLVHHSPGEDAAACLLHAAKVADMRESVTFLSLGHNRSADVEGAILTAMREGHWLVLLHAHAEPHWLHVLLPLLSSTTLPPVSSGGSPGEVHADFQLWVCVPTAAFGALPGALLTAAVVVALEPPRHIQVRPRNLSAEMLFPHCQYSRVRIGVSKSASSIRF